MNNLRVNILVSCHKPADVVKDSVFTPIQVGCDVKGHEQIKDVLHDNTGDNISSLNEEYCELTAQYWAWKNLDLDYYGFCHYRRYFNFSDKQYAEDPYGNILETYITDASMKKYGINADKAEELVRQYDIVTTERKDLREIPGDFSTPAEQYKTAPFLRYQDYQLMLKIIDEQYPQYSQYAHQFSNGHTSCFCNMYIMRKDLFFSYCAFMFGVLKEFCARTDMTRYSTEARRTPGHLSERLLNIYLLYLKDTNPKLRIKELQCVLFSNTEPHTLLHPAFPDRNVPVVFAADDTYSPMFAAALQSLMDHSSAANNYDVVLIGTNISKDNRAKLLGMTAQKKNVSLRFYDPGILIQNYDLKANAHITKETYYRFLIQAILPDYEKVLYLDSDLVINADVADLYHTDISDYMLAAARDPDFLGQINGQNPDTMEYVRSTFLMKDPYNYFQAGVILFNEKKMREAYSLEEWLKFAMHPYRYNDQDVLNFYCENKVYYLDMAWNFITDCNHERVPKVIVYSPDYIQKAYAEARKAPKIIHYAGFKKPWHNPAEDFAVYFWNAEKETPFYEEMLYRMCQNSCREDINARMSGISAAADHQTVRARTKMVNALFPHGTKRRSWLDRQYVKFTKR